MKNFQFIICSIALFGLLYIADQSTNEVNKKSQVDRFSIPPTDQTIVKEDMENGEFRDLKKAWFEAVHSCDSATDWRVIEKRNALKKYKALSSHDNTKSNGSIDIGNGQLIGKWVEKGSINQSGSILKTAYNKFDNRLYAIADGGSIWKGTIDGLNWEVVNQDLRFDGRFLDIVFPGDADFRIIAAIGGVPYYLDSGSEVWIESKGISGSTLTETKNQLIVNDGSDIFFLHQAKDSTTVNLMHSDDYGKNYTSVRTFPQTELRKLTIGANPNGEEVFLIEQTSISLSNIYQFNFSLNKLALWYQSSSISFGDLGRGNIQISGQENSTKFFVYDEYNNFKISHNKGITWSTLSTLPVKPWDVGIYVSPSNPQNMILGAIEAYTSNNAGRTWEKVNDWPSYYLDKNSNLHADIMYIAEYQTNETDNSGLVTMVSSHGGISRSFDFGQNFFNISLGGLNVTQYYSVKTYPSDDKYIFAGSQDQGLQRTRDMKEGPETFTQIISGDYGQLQFTNVGRSLWAVYPGGWITYFYDPTDENAKITYDDRLLTNNKSVWLPPTLASPYDNSTILVAGGTGLLNTTGSHIVSFKVDEFNGIFVSHHGNFDFSISGGDVSALAYNPININEFYALTTNGKFYKSTDQGINFTEKTVGLTTPDNLYGSFILTSKLDANKVIISGSGYNNASVFVSNDGGENFESMSEGLPKTSVFQLAYNEEENLIFAATEAGPYVYLRGEGRWYDLAQGKAPNQRYWSVEYLPSKKKVRYGTYGRGIWDLNIERVMTDLSEVSNNSVNLEIFPNPTSDYINVKGINSANGIIQIINTRGKVLYNSKIENIQNLKIDISNYANGLYYLIFDDGNKLSSSILVKS